MRIFKSWRKLFIVFMLILCVPGVCFGASSEDISVYVRYDVFSARMDAFMSEIRLMNEQLRSEIKQDVQEINARIDATNARLDVTNARLDDLYTMVYWGLALMGIFVGLIAFTPAFVNMFQNIRKPSVTLEQVERLIEAKLSEKLP